ncbi:helix-turn-helix domain-containing protein [Microbacterium sp. MRS-1]|uniref:helix-turn-helix domain-containing protein n=1 Tax=Microbacterium sp. MRS-1 TaxID=1451261 RepID=UPI00044D7EFA|nr:helix-turn-helix domain-containing protein [Microbacterium sp. MRS-1]EXJ51496.1 hypothetical protein AS96_09295 [Microbacterium sp. MRS-1]
MNDTIQQTATGRLLTLPESMERLRVSKATLYRLIRDREIPSVKIAARRFIFESDLERFLTHQRVAQRPGAHHG